jgi:hypothetical protein
VSSTRVSLRESIWGFNIVQPETRFNFQSAKQIARFSEHSSLYLLLRLNKHGRRTIQSRKNCLGQSAKSKIPYHLITSYIDCPWGSGIDFNTDKAASGVKLLKGYLNTNICNDAFENMDAVTLNLGLSII